jgi:Flp pilus assembly pilin Flp
MLKLINALRRDEAGFIVSAELVLISTIVVLSMVVGLSEVAINVNNELEDVGSAFGSINQSFCYRMPNGKKGHTTGSHFQDRADQCDGQNDITCNTPPQAEAGCEN